MPNYKKTLLTQLAIARVVVGALVGGMAFFGSNIKKSTDKIVELRQALLDRNNSIKAYSSLKNQYDSEAKADLATLQKSIPVEDDLINLSKDIEVLANLWKFA